MKAATQPHRPARVVSLDASNEHNIRSIESLPDLFRAGDLLILNDAGTLPASLGAEIRGVSFELRLAARDDDAQWLAIAFGAGSWREDTNTRPPPPRLGAGDVIAIQHPNGKSSTVLCAEVIASSGDRLLRLRFGERMGARGLRWLDGDALLRWLYRVGAPVQYSYHTSDLPLAWLQTPLAARPWSMEMPSAGRMMTPTLLHAIRARGVDIATLTHAAGLSATGSAELDRQLPFPERYELPLATVEAIARCSGRIIAVGTTVVRAIEANALLPGGLQAGRHTAHLRLDAHHQPQIVDVVIAGVHAPGESHFELLRAFAHSEALEKVFAAAEQAGMQNHELGDFCWIEGPPRVASRSPRYQERSEHVSSREHAIPL